jgi:hypothetical protein
MWDEFLLMLKIRNISEFDLESVQRKPGPWAAPLPSTNAFHFRRKWFAQRLPM